MMEERPLSNALVCKRSSDMALMPPPSVKKIKRPKKVLDEDSYTEALSRIIARDFFPGLLEAETQQEYLDALESKDNAWIASAGRRLQHVMTPTRARGPTPLATRPYDAGRTPTTSMGEIPASEAPTAIPVPPRLDINMSLSEYQSTYTSEDNESFYKLIDRHNQKKADKYAWLWRGNKLPSKQMIKQKEVEDRLALTGSLTDDGFIKRDRLAIKDSDHRPARPDGWRIAPKNNLMFVVDGVEDGPETIAAKAAEASRMGPRSINYANTSVPEPNVPKRPPSPTASSIRDAVAGKPRAKDQDSSFGGDETPRVNGYAFVDDEDDEPTPSEPLPIINLGPGDTNNPFKIQHQRARETLHERMVERISKSNKEASRNGLTGKVDKTPVSKFPSSSRVTGNLTPAAQRLWSKIGTPGKVGGSSFGQLTPMKSRGSLKSVTRPRSKD